MEIISIRELYQESILPDLIPKTSRGTPTQPTTMPLRDIYLSVYVNNTEKLGMFRTDDAKTVIRYYMDIIRLIDSIDGLNRRWSNYAIESRVVSALEKYPIAVKNDLESSINTVIHKTNMNCWLEDYQNMFNTAVTYQRKLLDNQKFEKVQVTLNKCIMS